MSGQGEKKHLREIADRMRAEWDRRISHDYRYWMSDGVEDDRKMWDSGLRDFEIIISGLNPRALKTQAALEIGCGVGRLLRPAAGHFSRVIGVDVSPKAIDEARTLLSDLNNVELIAGNGIDLSQVATASIDFAFTFAALSSMPVTIIASYLVELARVMRGGGVARLQMYLGEEQQTCAEDTLAIRCFPERRFVQAAEQAGFSVECIEELHLPFEISCKEEGLIAKIASLVRNDQQVSETEDLAQVLHSKGEESLGAGWTGSRTEYLMALARAQQHMDSGDVEGAKEALRFAISHYSQPEEDIVALLSKLERVETSSQSSERSSGMRIKPKRENVSVPKVTGSLGDKFNLQLYQQNLQVLRERFPDAAREIEAASISDALSVAYSTSGAPVLSYRKTVLSHAEKPERAGESWAERTLNSLDLSATKTLVVVGFADGYHIRALARKIDKALCVVEPRAEILKAALGSADCRELLDRVTFLAVSSDGFKRMLKDLDPEQSHFIVHPQSQAVSGAMVSDMKRLFRTEKGFEKLQPNFAVVGPMWGGSQPIAGYTVEALKALKQRVTTYDLGDFYKPFLGLQNFLSDKNRRGVVENQYLEMLSQLVLEGVSERPVDIVICLAQAPLTPRVLKELRSRGIITVMWFVEDCRRFLTWQQIAPYYDYMFIIQKDEFPQLVEQAGAGRAIYLPVGCDPGIHRPIELSEEEKRRFGSELSFVGAGYNNRRHVFSTLAHRNFKIWGTEWPACLPFTRLVQDQGARIAVEDYIKVFNSSLININLHSSSERDGVEPFGDFVNPRTFELAATGAFQLVDERRLLPENFVMGEEVATFTDEKTLEEKADYYLAHPDERMAIVDAGRKRALKDHTYSSRIRTMLDYIYADRYEELSARVQRSPWHKTFESAKQFPELHNRFKAVYERGDEPRLGALVEDIKTGKGTLTETEQMLLFLHHIGGQISHISKLRENAK